jgi:putative membrane protein
MAQENVVQLAALRSVNTKLGVRVVMGVSVAALALLVFVIYGHGHAEAAPAWVGYLPAVNAALNATSAVFLVLGGLAIRRRALPSHAKHMLRALFSSALFLVSYLVYHWAHGDSKFQGHGAIRPVYFVILISHVLLSAVVLPLIFTSFFMSLSGRFPAHKKVSRYTFPLWLYVSVTGVLVFALLRAYS